MSKDNQDQKFPLTKQQQGLWIEWKLHPENTSYNTCVKVKLKGNIDTEQLSQALRDIVQYFDSLKVYFIEQDGIPYQCIKDTGVYFLDYQDISITGQEETHEQAQSGLDFLSKTLNTAIDLKSFPIVRASLMKVADQTYYFIGMVPHMISDGRSAVLFLESLSIAYNDGYQGLCDAYDATSKSWSNFYQDERNQLDAEKHALSKTYWQQRLAGANHYFDYSYGRKITTKDDKQGHRVYFDIPAELAKALKTHTGKNKTTLFNVMVCAFGIFIHRYFSLTDILIGFPVNIRPPGYKHLFGFFVNIVPIRIDLSGDPSYQELLARVSKSRKEDKRHQKFPALDIVNAVRENNTDFDGQLFNLSMAQTVSRLFNLELEGVETQALESEYNDVNDDLSLSYELLEDGIGLWFEYRTSMFDQHFIHQGIEHIRQILEQMTNAPETRLSEFKLLNNHQKQELSEFSIGRLQNSQHQYDELRPKTNLAALFEYQVSINSSAIALRSGNEKITYLQLNQAANQLARQLKDLGISPCQTIAVCLNRGVALITSLLAIVKTGCCYVPIAPDYPRQRLQFIIDDTECNVIIFEAGTADLCTQLTEISLDYYASIGQRETLSQDDLQLTITQQDTAYIIYTSGSTGTPKGVPISHENLLPRLHCLQQEIPLNTTDVMLQNTDFSFDVSVAEMFWPLTSGAALALAEQHQSKFPDQLLELIVQHQVTACCMVPSLLNALLSVAKPSQMQSIKYLLAAGEVLSPRIIGLFYQYCSGRLFNFYGPTEATIYAIFYECPAEFALSATPIGTPLVETEAYILDQHLQVQPKGVAGELYLSGKCISSGYINRPELNKTAFIINPFNASSDNKLYRTGDKVRYLDDGKIDFLGRIDQQVKIRGYRIELKEIEVVLGTIKDINDVAVVVEKEDPVQAERNSASQRLLAYFERKNKTEDSTIFIDGLKQYLREKLPAYMLPSLFIEVTSIPRSQSGKVLDNRLPAPSSIVNKKAKYTPASTAIEHKLVHIWASILKLPVEKIGINDSFFELGGDSLMAIQFASLAEEQSLHLDITSLFDSQTIAEISQLIKQPSTIASSQQSIEGEFPLTGRQYQFFNDDFVNHHHWNRQFTFKVVKNISVKALTKAFNQVLQHHDGLRVKFVQKVDAKWVQISQPSSKHQQTVFYHDLSVTNEIDQQQAMENLIEEAHRYILIDQAPLIKAIYFKLGNNIGYLVIISHHLLLDMVSSRIVFEDLMKCYEYFRRGLSCKLPHKTASLKQWTEYLQNYATAANFDQALNYWGAFPKQPSPKLPIDFDVDKKSNLEAQASTFTVKLSKPITDKLLTEIPAEQGYKIQDLLLVALLKLTRNWTNDDQLMVNICGHGRNSNQANINLSRTVGWLNTVFPIRLDAAGIADDDIEQLVETVHQQLSKVPNNNMDYNILRYVAKHPLITQQHSPEIFFNYVGQIDAIIPDNVPFKPTEGLQNIPAIDGRNHLCYLLYFEAGVSAEQLNIRLTYCKNIFSQQLIERLSQGLLTAIEEIVAFSELVQHPA